MTGRGEVVIIINVVASERRRAKLENDTETIEEERRRETVRFRRVERLDESEAEGLWRARMRSEVEDKGLNIRV